MGTQFSDGKTGISRSLVVNAFLGPVVSEMWRQVEVLAISTLAFVLFIFKIADQ